MLRTSFLRSSSRAAALVMRPAQVRAAHAISNPTLADIEKRWDVMPPQEQADLWMTLRDRMKVNWTELTPQEKKAAYYIAFGAHGPRALDPPGETKQVLMYTTLAMVASLLLFIGIRSLGGDPPSTMTREWEEASNEYLKREKSEPITGLSSEGYTGTGQIQSAPKKK